MLSARGDLINPKLRATKLYPNPLSARGAQANRQILSLPGNS
ncbi:MAG TPA: hypothetical protein VGG19_12050 [Tepidisphaeraceae bacterium]